MIVGGQAINTGCGGGARKAAQPGPCSPSHASAEDRGFALVGSWPVV